MPTKAKLDLNILLVGWCKIFEPSKCRRLLNRRLGIWQLPERSFWYAWKAQSNFVRFTGEFKHFWKMGTNE